MKATTIRPGLLVSLKSTISGGVSYQRVDLAHEADAEKDVSKWETTRVIEDPIEHDRAVKTRARALQEIRRLCSATSFGLLCPVDREVALDGAIARAREIADEHNRGATFTRVSIWALKGRIASTDEEAVRAISEEVSQLVASMNSGIDRLDPASIRDAANRARELSSVLEDREQAVVETAIEQARKAARQIVKRIEKQGEEAAVVLADIQRGALERARIAFLDLTPGDDAPVESLPSVERQRFADLEIDGEEAN